VVVPLGIGVVIGVVGLRLVHTDIPRRRLSEGGLLVLGLVVIGLAGTGRLDAMLREAGVPFGALPLVIAVAIVAGAAYAVTAVTAQTNLTESTPADVRGRVFGVLASIVSIGSLVPTLVAGPLADRVSTAAAIVVAGVVLVAIATWSIRAKPS
jgi:MFS family permease